MSTDIKLKGGLLGNMIGNLGKKNALIDLDVPLAKDVLHKLAVDAASAVIDKFDRKRSWRVVISAGKGFTLFI